DVGGGDAPSRGGLSGLLDVGPFDAVAGILKIDTDTGAVGLGVGLGSGGTIAGPTVGPDGLDFAALAPFDRGPDPTEPKPGASDQTVLDWAKKTLEALGVLPKSADGTPHADVPGQAATDKKSDASQSDDSNAAKPDASQSSNGNGSKPDASKSSNDSKSANGS